MSELAQWDKELYCYPLGQGLNLIVKGDIFIQSDDQPYCLTIGYGEPLGHSQPLTCSRLIEYYGKKTVDQETALVLFIFFIGCIGYRFF